MSSVIGNPPPEVDVPPPVVNADKEVPLPARMDVAPPLPPIPPPLDPSVYAEYPTAASMPVSHTPHSPPPTHTHQQEPTSTKHGATPHRPSCPSSR